ncbi:ATP-binding domain-containing protein [Paucibacter sp. B2R-40]|uniref:ATP-binding domain-containing protein n=1 Tax=Paucibacter sp. B2R-40 TaxID=2893554 RepID=UPI0021E4CDEC|nr:ATP-binding domain-containing protein [Paucibacter sp. B2R-40]MCV2356564.1 ATP-binding domain-containing protein [Paucibacter sp. B2R-40]
MARVHPPLSTIRPITAGDYAELAILKSLADGLPSAYELFHSVDWATVHPNHDKHGELDIVVVNSAGDVALLEVKAGAVSLTEQGVFKRYGVENKDVARQVATQFDAVMHRLRSAGLGARLMHFLVLPDMTAGEHSSIAFPRERIADASDCVDLPGYVQRTLGAGLADPLRERVCAFFENRLALEPDVSALAGSLQARVTKISGGLADWVPRIEAPSGVIRVRATAGSGKTQLALRLLRDASLADKQAAYVCFNRPLADHVRDIAPQAAKVHTFHQLCWEAAGRPVGPKQDYEALGQRYLEMSEKVAPDLDLLVLDELQDMQADWVQALISRLRVDARVYLLDDPSQSLYPDREELEFPDAVVVRSNENYRSPRRLVGTINMLRLTPELIQACSPFEGEQPGLHSYRPEEEGLERATIFAIQRCIDKGFALPDIAVLCWRGREKSQLMGEAKLGPWSLSHFDGSYDEQGRPNWTEGLLRIETLRRFKGQSAQAVVLTEVQFDELGSAQRNLLFVGLTRASMHLELVLSEFAEAALVREISLTSARFELVAV